MDQIVPLARYVDDGEVPGTSRQSLAVNETELEIMQFVENSSIEYVSELANDENHLLQSVSLNESDSEQQVEPEINVDSSKFILTTYISYFRRFTSHLCRS